MLAALLIGGVLLGGLQSRNAAANRIDPITSTVQNSLQPGSRVMLSASDGISGFFAGISRASQLRKENELLRSELDAMHTYMDDSRAWELQADEVRGLLNLPAFGEKKRAYARIVSYNLEETTVTLSVGSKAGVRPGYAVVTAKGLLGVVDSVSDHSCQAFLVTSPSVQVGAKVIRDIPIVGLIKGETPNRLELSVVDNTPMEINDKVVTSGLSDYIPPNIPIGEVIEVINREELGVRLAKVFPFARIGSATQAAVLIP